MLSIAHSLTGAYIASQLPSPLAYGPLTLAAHYLQDWIPHWDFGTGMSVGKRSKMTAVFLEILELIVSVGLLWFFFQKGHTDIRWHIWIAALIGILPDLLDAPRNFLKIRIKILDPLYDLHHWFHHSTPNVAFGLLPQVIVVVLVLWLI